MARIVLDMPDSEAWALAQFCKRLMPEISSVGHRSTMRADTAAARRST